MEFGDSVPILPSLDDLEPDQSCPTEATDMEEICFSERELELEVMGLREESEFDGESQAFSQRT